MPLKLAARFDTALNALLDRSDPVRLGVAVSGGGDSMALLHLLSDWARDNAADLRAVTVDHGLRAAAVQEAAEVARVCDQLGIAHDTLRWTGWDQSGNLQDQARRARYRLMADWAQRHGLQAVALGHTMDDQAETLLMRLARGSGVDGLSAMAPLRDDMGARWLRPLLAIRRAELRAFLEQAGIAWLDDPSNTDARFSRVKTRQALALLAGLDIDVPGLADTAARMAQARAALEHATQQAARDICQVQAGAVRIETAPLIALPAEIRRRLLNHALRWVSGQPYAPRHAALAVLEAAIGDRRASTLHGCLISPDGADFTVARELSALAGVTARAGDIWDNRWRVSGPGGPHLTVRALGETGLAQCAHWRACGAPRSALLSSPAIWNGTQLLAAPCAGFANGWRAELVHGENHFVTSVLSH